MLFLGSTFLGDRYTLDATPTNVSNITSVKLQNGIYDELYMTKDMTKTYSTVIPTEWDFNTILHALFAGNLNCGNVDFAASQVSNVLIKRRKVGDFNWLTLANFEIENSDSFNFEFYDRFVRAKTEYEYAIVPVLNGIEGNLNINTIKAEFEGLFLIEKDKQFYTPLNVTIDDIKRNKPIQSFQH